MQELGIPDAIFRSKEHTYYLYDATGDFRMIWGAVFVIPPFYVPFWASEADSAALHCLALIFDERGLLQDYLAQTAPVPAIVGIITPYGGASEPFGEEISNCVDVLWDEEELVQLDRIPQYKAPQFIEGRALTFAEVDGLPLVIAADRNHTLYFWDVRTDRFLERSLSGHQAMISSIAIGRLDNVPVVITGSEDWTVRIWDLQTGRLLGKPLSGHDGRILSVALIEIDGIPRVFSSGEDGTIRMWDAHSGTVLEKYVLEGQALLLGDAGGRPVAVTGSFDESLYLWDVLAGHFIGEPLLNHGSLGSAVITAVDGKPILASGGIDNTVRILDIQSGKLMREPLHGHKTSIVAIAVGEIDDVPVVASVDKSNTMFLWELRGTGPPLTQPMISAGHQITAITLFELNGMPAIATSTADHNVRLWDAHHGRRLGELRWYDPIMKRAEEDDPEAQMRVYSHLIQTDHRQAFYWLCKAAENGHFQAQLELAGLYWRGSNGIEKDLIKSYAWYSLAQKQGANKWYVWELREVKKQMTSEQQAEADELLEAFETRQCEHDWSLYSP